MLRARHGAYVVYMVRCTDGTYYTGATNNLEARIKLHNAGNGAKYLRGKGPVTLVYTKGYQYYRRALQAEARLKKLTRGEKEMLVQRYAGPTDFLSYGREIKDVGPSVRVEE